MQRTTGLTLFGNFITDNEEEQLRRMLTEFLVVRKGYDVTDYLEVTLLALHPLDLPVNQIQFTLVFLRMTILY